jgi:hypothetical protein
MEQCISRARFAWRLKNRRSGKWLRAVVVLRRPFRIAWLRLDSDRQRKTQPRSQTHSRGLSTKQRNVCYFGSFQCAS